MIENITKSGAALRGKHAPTRASSRVVPSAAAPEAYPAPTSMEQHQRLPLLGGAQGTA